MKKTKEVKACRPRWMVQHPNGEWFCYSERYSRKQCIEDFVRDCQAAYRDPPYTPKWADLKREGYDCVRVSIVPVPKKRKRK